jgi:hypothetical protein
MPIVRKPLPPVELLRAVLDYDPDTGTLTWKRRPAWTFRGETVKRVGATWNAQHPGRPAFYTPNRFGHLNGYINGTPYLAHRIIWKLVTGKEPDFIDHIDGNPGNNRWSNLRSGGASMNSRNMAVPNTNTSGVSGVHWHKTNRTWTANIHAGGKLKHLGTFKDKTSAIKARQAAEKFFGYHPNHGRQRLCRNFR